MNGPGQAGGMRQRAPAACLARRLAVCAGLWLLTGALAGPAAAQEPAAPEAMPQETTVQTTADAPSTVYLEKLRRCYRPAADRIAPGDEIEITVRLEPQGEHFETPRLVGFGPMSPGQRALLRSALAMLEACGRWPITDGGFAGAEVRLKARADRLDLASVTPLAPGTGLIVRDDPAATAAPAGEDEAALGPDDLAMGVAVMPDRNAVTTEADEAALELTVRDRREIQRRLVLMEHITRGVDGVFGRGTREAISGWQQAQGFPPTGFLSAAQLGWLNNLSETRYQAWLKAEPSTANSGKRYHKGSDGCLRTKPDNKRSSIIFGRSGFCNLRALGLK